MILPAADAERVVHLLSKLDIFADKKLGLKTGITLKDVPTELRNKVRVQWYERPEVLEEYIQTNPDRHSPQDLALLSSWRGRKRKQYMVVKCLKSGVIMTDTRHYQVLGWYDPLESMMDRSPPLMVETTLLPCGDKITYDGILFTFNVTLGPGIRKTLNEEYSYARRHGAIYTSLESDPQPPPPTAPAACSHRPAVQAILQNTEKLRGGGTRPLHSPALAMLRWAAQLAATSMEDSPNPQDLRKQLGQIRKAYSQIDRILYEGDC